MNKPDAKEYIKRRYLFPLIIVFSLLVILIGYKYYKYEERVIIKNKSEELKAIGELKENQIKKWREERLNDITNISQSRLFSRRLEEYLRNPSDSESGKDILDRIKLFRNTYNYGNTCITNREGKILLSASDSITAIDPIFIPDIIKSAETKTFLMGDFNYCPSRNEILIMTASPVLNSENEVIAVLVLESNPYEFLYPYVQNWPTDSKTAETIILRKEGDSVLYLNELRHQKNTALKLKFPLSQLHMPEVKTIKEEQGVSEGIDYRGEEVLAYYSKIDNSPWYLVSKIDRKEILSELKFRGIFIIIIACLLILFSLTSAAYIYNQRQKYIYKSLFEKETELQKSQQEFRTILYSIGDGVISTDKNGIVQVMNPVAERLTGWREKESLGRKLDEVFQVIDSDTRKKIENPVKQVLNKGLITGFAEHSLLISRSGAEYPIADAGSPVKDDDGNTIGVVIVFSDRTEERKELNNLRESEDWFKYIFESANAGKSITFLSGELNANKYFCKMLGYSPGELKNKKWQDITHTEDIDFIQKQTERLLIGEKESIRFEKRYIHKNGSIVWADVSVTLRRDKEGKPLHFITTLIDITSRKEAEEELRNSEERFRTLFETMEQGVVYQNSDGKITMANPAAERILGLTKKQMQGLTSSDPNWRAIKEDGSEYPGNEHPSMTALKTGKPVTGNLMGVYNHKNGNYRWILINATPLFRNGEENPY